MRGSALPAALLILVFLAISIDGARTQTPTVDEFAHLPAGCRALHGEGFDLYPNDPPLARLWMALPVVAGGAALPPARGSLYDDWAPWIYGLDFLQLNRERYLDDFFRARLAIAVLAAAGGLLLFIWAGRLYGPAAALGALFLYTFSPNIQAHGRLATVDAASSTTFLLMFFLLDHYRREPGWRRLIGVGISLGLSLLTKFTAILAVPVLALLLALLSWQSSPPSSRFAQRSGWTLGHALPRFAALCGVALLVVNLGYGLRSTLQPLGSFQWKSEFAVGLAELLPADLRVPFPRDFVEGFDLQTLDTERGEFGSYFAGTWRRESPAVATPLLLLLKLPIPTLLLLGWTLFSLRRSRGSLAEELTIWLPPSFLMISFMFFSVMDPAIRYLLPALPFLYLAISRLLVDAPSLRTPRGGLLLACGAWLVSITAWIHPHQLSYFNLVAGGPAQGHEWFIDSNLDWGQDLAAVPSYMEEHGLESVYLLYFGHVEPELYGIRYALPPPEPRPGTYIVSVNFAKGYRYVTPDHWRSVRYQGPEPPWWQSAEPVDRIGHSLWVYRVP